MAKRERRPRLLLVEWIDSEFVQEGWKSLAELAEYAGPGPCHSVGWEIKGKAKGHLMLACSLFGDGTEDDPYHAGEAITIPRVNIKRTRVLGQS